MENNFQPQFAQPSTQAPKKNLPRDVFLHLLAMVTLYWSAVSFITLCWQYINYLFPDVLHYGYSADGSIRFAVSSLIIVFPIFILVSWFLNRIYARESQVRESRIRKWLVYLTLFITALVIIGDLVFVINTFLGGEITARFILKALSVLVVAAIVFSYYLGDIRKSEPSKSAKYYAFATSALMLIAIVGAFFIVGSPVKARLAQLDWQKINDLQNIQWQVVNYWQRKGVLAQSLTDLNDSISGYVAPVDPETNQSYQYSVKDSKNLNFELCTTFNLDSNMMNRNTNSVPIPAKYPGEMSQNWAHSAGYYCFDRTIDQQLYPPLDKGK